VGVAGDDDEKVDGNDDEMKDGNGHPPPKGTKKAVGKDGVGNEKLNGNSGDGNDEGKDSIFYYLAM
jgi:hypothetical protein